jgi:hypothetical protein
MKKNITQMKITTKLLAAGKEQQLTVTDFISFEDNQFRRIYDKKSGTWYFSVIDMIRALTGSSRPSVYWSIIKKT